MLLCSCTMLTDKKMESFWNRWKTTYYNTKAHFSKKMRVEYSHVWRTNTTLRDYDVTCNTFLNAEMMKNEINNHNDINLANNQHIQFKSIQNQAYTSRRAIRMPKKKTWNSKHNVQHYCLRLQMRLYLKFSGE